MSLIQTSSLYNFHNDDWVMVLIIYSSRGGLPRGYTVTCMPAPAFYLSLIPGEDFFLVSYYIVCIKKLKRCRDLGGDRLLYKGFEETVLSSGDCRALKECCS